MTTRINEKCTLLSNAKKVMQQQNELHTKFTDTDFLRLFNEHFDCTIKGKVLSCDIEIYNMYGETDAPNTLEIELTVLTNSIFYIIKYLTNFDWYVDSEITRFYNERTLDYVPFLDTNDEKTHAPTEEIPD